MVEELRPLFDTLSALFKALMIQLIILGMGGPTGVAINPARDLAPRCAHFILPIPNKVGAGPVRVRHHAAEREGERERERERERDSGSTYFLEGLLL